MRHLAQEATDDKYVTASGKGENEQLSDDHKLWIIDYYASRIPIYGSLLEEYKKDKTKRRNLEWISVSTRGVATIEVTEAAASPKNYY